MKNGTTSLITLAFVLATNSAAHAQTVPTGASPESVQTPTGATPAAGVATRGKAQTDATVGGDIIVTAQKRSETLTAVPLSITAVGGEQLKSAGVTSVTDLTRLVPGFAFQPSDYGSPIYTLRGVGLKNLAIADSPTVSVYLDQVPLPFSEMTRGVTLDLERVEVLKGPQGTLFGQNSTGGAINYIAARPTNVFEGNASLTYGSFNEVDGELELSGPLSDTVKARFAVRTEQRDGYQESQTRDDTLGKRNFTTSRLILDWEPSSALKFSLNLNGWLDRSDTPAAQFLEFDPATPNGRQTLVPYLTSLKPAPNNNRLADWDPGVDLRRNDHLIQASLRADWTVAPDLTLTSITAYSTFHELSPIDPDGTSADDFRLTIHGDIDSVSQELRLSGEALDHKLKYVVGGNYESDITKDDQSYQFQGTDTTAAGLDFNGGENSNHSNLKSYAAFVSLEYALTNTLNIYGSARYTQSTIDFRGCLFDDGVGDLAAAFSRIATGPIAPGGCVTLDPTTFKPVSIVTSSLSQHNVPFRAGISYRPSSGENYYFNITKGYKAGSYPTVPGFFPSQFAPVTQETVVAYELGVKRSFLGGKVRASGAVFYYDYTNKQLLGNIVTAFGPLSALITIPKSDIKGAELQIDVRPVHGWTVSLGGTYVDSRVTSSFIGSNPLGQSVNFKDEKFPGVPKFQVNLDNQYNFPISASLKGSLGGTVSYRSEAQASFGELPLFNINGYALLDLRAAIESGPWRLQVFGHNVTNKFYVTNVNHAIDIIARTVGAPATYGVTLSRHF